MEKEKGLSQEMRRCNEWMRNRETQRALGCLLREYHVGRVLRGNVRDLVRGHVRDLVRGLVWGIEGTMLGSRVGQRDSGMNATEWHYTHYTVYTLRGIYGNAFLTLSLQMDAALAKTYWGLPHCEDTKRIRLHFKKDKKIWLKWIRSHLFEQMQWYKFDMWKGCDVYRLEKMLFFTSFKISMNILFHFGLSI